MARFEKVAWDDYKHWEAFKTIPPCTNEYVHQVMDRVKGGLYELWSINDEAFMTSQVDIIMSGERALRIHDICGKFTAYFDELSVFVESLAKHYKCDTIILNTHRKALVKIYTQHGFKVSEYVLERKVDNGREQV